MAAGKRCMSCMHGTIVNGICNSCHRKEKAPPPNALPVESILHGRYCMGNVLGQGGFGITYAAWDRKENRRVAVKELYPSGDVSREADRCTVQIRKGQETYFAKVYNCFEQEAKMLMRLQGLEGVVSLYHIFSDNNTIYYSMEYLDGMDMGAFLTQNGRMPWEKLAPVTRTLLKALDRLHKEGLIHRDISPDNIFLTKDGTPRLIDFGSVRVYQGNDHFTAFVKRNFAPWEQYQAEGRQGPWTDIYAFCVTLYYALSGQLPPIASNRRLQDTVIPLGQLCPALPANVVNAVMYGMAVRMQERCQSARELEQLLFAGEGNTTSQLSLRLVCCGGQYKGRQWQLAPGSYYRIGRQPDCEIPYPANIQGISRVQCTVYMDENGRVMIRDEKSSYGTYLGAAQEKVRLEPGRWYLANGCWILFGQQEQYLIQ